MLIDRGERSFIIKMKKVIITYKMRKEIIMFDNNKVEKHKFHQHKNPISMYDVNINRIVVSTKFPFSKKGFKYFIGYENYYEEIMSLCILLPKLSGYKRHFDETKYMSFLIKNNELLEKYKEVWDNVSKTINHIRHGSTPCAQVRFYCLLWEHQAS